MVMREPQRWFGLQVLTCSKCGGPAQYKKVPRDVVPKCFECKRLEGLERSKVNGRKKTLARNEAEVLNNRKRAIEKHKKKLLWLEKGPPKRQGWQKRLERMAQRGY